MNAAEPFLRAIHDRPDDDAPRLVYADWLDERGDADRAEFIRVQCALARAHANDPRRAAWQARERELLERHHTEWGGLLHEWFPNLDFRRGFLYCTGFDEFPRPVGDQGVLRLLADVQVVGIRELTLRRSQLTDQGVEALAASWQVRELDYLDLAYNRISPAGAEALARSSHLSRLNGLNLGANDLGDAGIAALFDGPAFRLQWLSLRGNRISDTGLRTLADSPVLTQLYDLDVGHNQIGDAGALALISSAHFPSLRAVTFYGNQLTEAGRQSLLARFAGRLVYA
jgi:uncharacterized protein (TIGR02996 family)